MALLKTMRHRPRWLLLENVHGFLGSDVLEEWKIDLYMGLVLLRHPAVWYPWHVGRVSSCWLWLHVSILHHRPHFVNAAIAGGSICCHPST
eukprot:18644-Eustigmatos_ZCMA.PRE.1